MTTVIAYEEIRKGDKIRTEWDFEGNHYSVEGVANSKFTEGWVNEKSAFVTRTDRDQTIYLIKRPKPALPTQEGTVIIAEQPAEEGPVALVLRDGKWWYLDGFSFYYPTAVFDHPWRLAKVVEA